MPDRHIIGVGFSIGVPANIQWESLSSDHSLADADIILFKPDLGSLLDEAIEDEGQDTLAHPDFYSVQGELEWWLNELTVALNHGKTVIVFLSRFMQVQMYRESAMLNNYQCLPLIIGEHRIGRGHRVRLTGRLPALADYWNDFGRFSEYEMHFASPSLDPLMLTATGDRVVGGLARVGKGTIIALPPVNIPVGATSPDQPTGLADWGSRMEQLGQHFVARIVALDQAVRADSASTLPPPWAQGPEFRTAVEERLIAERDRMSTQIAQLTYEREQLTAELHREAQLRDLLYGTGKLLERAIVAALHLMGFEAENFQEEDSEFDAVFTSSEGRFLGEAEGKDNKAINIDKLDQLDRNLREDYNRDEVDEYAKGVLFGNAHRLAPLDQRGDYFTEKCMKGANRSKIALVRTPDLFGVARYIRDHDDPVYARDCRQAIVTTEGAVVMFPLPPYAETS